MIRIITGIALVLVFLLLFILPPNVSFVGLLVITLIMAYEYAPLVGMEGRIDKLCYYIGTILTIATAGFIAGFGYLAFYIRVFLFVGLVFWLLTCILIFFVWRQRVPRFSKLRKIIESYLAIALFLLSVVYLAQEPYGRIDLFYVMTLIALQDTSAYFYGKAFGANKIAPAISPGKTQAGFFGSLVFCGLFGFICAQILSLSSKDAIFFVLVSVVVSIISVGGDLYESIYKRQTGIKDSGAIFPGHGGILDRLDSYIAGLPCFSFFIYVGYISF